MLEASEMRREMNHSMSRGLLYTVIYYKHIPQNITRVGTVNATVSWDPQAVFVIHMRVPGGTARSEHGLEL